MAKKTRKTSKVNKAIKRIFLITKIILCIVPFATLAYLSIGTSQYGLNYRELLQANPVLTVTFLSAMCQPIAAWLLTIAERRYDSSDYLDTLVSILLIFIAECMLKSWIGIAATALLFWLINRETPFTIKEELKNCTNWKAIIIDASGDIVLIFLSAFCLFASLRLG